MRGLGVAIVVALAVYLGWEYGARSLDALAVPLVVACVGAVLSVVLTDRPRVERRPVRPGSVGETRTVEFAVTTGRGTVATVVDAVGEGLAADGPGAAEPIDLLLSGETVVDYDVRLRVRGERAVGPTTIAVRDVLGLVERRFAYEERSTVVVYPPVYGLRGGARRDLVAIADAARRHDRDEFDHLREYQRGDALRDVHWKSAAKRPADELVVKEFVADEGFDRVSLAADASPGRDDEMAAAAATVATHLLDLGVGVDVTVPDGRERASAGDRPDRLLRLLATTGHGTIDDRRRREADVVVRADEDGTAVTLRDRTIPFDRLRGSVVRGVGADGPNEAVERADGSGEAAGVVA